MNKLIRNFIYSKYFPNLLYLITFIIWWSTIIIALFGIYINQYLNVTTVMSLWWVLWWPFVILSVLFVGRGWCGWFCPLGASSEFLNRFRLAKKAPNWMFWPGFPVLSFFFVVLSERVFGMIAQPTASAIFFITLAGLAAFSGIFMLKRSWCRFFCPIGMLLGVFSRLGMMRFSVDRKECENCNDRKCMSSCPTFVNIDQIETSRHCIMCFRCAKVCDKIELKSRAPGTELNNLEKIGPTIAESFFILMVMGLFLGVFTLRTTLFKIFEKWVTENLGSIYMQSVVIGKVNAIAFFGLVVLMIFFVIILAYSAGFLSLKIFQQKVIRNSKSSLTDIVTKMSYSYMPLAFFGSFVIMAGPLLWQIGYVTVTKLILLGIGIIWSSILIYTVIRDLWSRSSETESRIIPKTRNSPDLEIMFSAIPHLFIVSLLAGLYFVVSALL